MISNFKYLYIFLYIASALTTYQGLTSYSLTDVSGSVSFVVVTASSMLFVGIICFIQDKWHFTWSNINWHIKIFLIISVILLFIIIFFASTLYSIVNLSGVNPTLENMREITNKLNQLPLKLNQVTAPINHFYSQLNTYKKNSKYRADLEKQKLKEGPHYQANMQLARIAHTYSKKFEDIEEDNIKIIKRISGSIEDISKYRIWISKKKNNSQGQLNNDIYESHNEGQEILSYSQFVNKFEMLLLEIRSNLGKIQTSTSIHNTIDEIKNSISSPCQKLPDEKTALSWVREHSLQDQTLYILRIQQTKDECSNMMRSINKLQGKKIDDQSFINNISNLGILSPRKLIFLYPDLKAFALAIALDYGPFFLAFFLSIIGRKEDYN
ncbi:membrane protein [Candidatus Magnetomorum sp. HK-1]|nr:membrane protein [Candidatus Magnetomorum sp. HK-1]